MPSTRHSRALAAASARFATLAGAATLAAGLAGPVAGAGADPGRIIIPGTHPAWAVTPAGTTPVSARSGSVAVDVYLTPHDPTGLGAYAQAVSDPRNAAYGDYLTAAQAQARFAPTPAEADAVAAWLRDSGLRVTAESRGFGAEVRAAGPLSAAARAFGVAFARYSDPEGAPARAPESAASAPASVAADVLAVAGLDTAPDAVTPLAQLPPPGPGFFQAGPSSSFYGQNVATGDPEAAGTHQPWAIGGYTPQQLAGAYGVTASGMTGQGQTVAIVDAYASPTIAADDAAFAQRTGTAPFTAGQLSQSLPARFELPGLCSAQSWYTEETLDVEMVHSLAPAADVRYVAASNCITGLVSAEARIVDEHLASIVSNSWGMPAEADFLAPVYDAIFEAGATEGIGFFFATGDSGYNEPRVENRLSDGLQVDYPAESPYVTAVGGTALALGASGGYEWELPWGDIVDPLGTLGLAWSVPPPPTATAANFDGAGGGGVSTTYAQPSYQAGVVPASLATAVPTGTTTTPMRVIPDVSAVADEDTGVAITETFENPSTGADQLYTLTVGGTSLATPVVSAIEADAQQAAGHELGFANPAIYARAGSGAFHDVTETTPDGPAADLYQLYNVYADPATATGPLTTYLSTVGVDGQGAAALTATTGYDDATGVGTPAGYIASFAAP